MKRFAPTSKSLLRATSLQASLAGIVVAGLLLAAPLLAESPADVALDADLPETLDAVETPATECPTAAVPPTVEGEPLLSLEDGGVVYTAGGCSAWATCDDGSTVDCSSSGSGGTCSYQNANCPSTRGWVECDGNRTWCTTCEDDCSVHNRPGCSYFWNGVLGCCDLKPTATPCLRFCF